MNRMIAVAFLMTVASVSPSFAAHPLLTDDTRSQGRGGFQIEVNSELTYDEENDEGITTKETGGKVSSILSYGITENVDIVIGVHYQWFRVKEDGSVVAREDGISDVSLEMKQRLYEKDGVSLALKPGITLPTGSEEKGLGRGRIAYSAFLIASQEFDPWTFHLNFGYRQNENKHDERKSLWHASLASEMKVVQDLTLVANIGVERNTDKESNSHPAFVLGGIIYSFTENLDINAGIKGGLNNRDTDSSVLVGMAWRL